MALSISAAAAQAEGAALATLIGANATIEIRSGANMPEAAGRAEAGSAAVRTPPELVKLCPR